MKTANKNVGHTHQWSVQTFSGYAGGARRESRVNLIIEGKADTVEEVRDMVDRAVNCHDELVQCLHNLVKMTEDGDITTVELAEGQVS